MAKNKEKLEKVVLIAGCGVLPKKVYDACVKKSIECTVIGLDGEISEDVFQGVSYVKFKTHKISKILQKLKEMNVRNIVLTGRVSRVHISKLLFDSRGVELFKSIMKKGLNDSSLLSIVTSLLENEGFNIVPADEIADDMVANAGVLTVSSPNERDLKDISQGFEILEGIARYDIGQSLIINEGLVLGVEAAEGTDALIKRCVGLRRGVSGGVLIKICKPNQDQRVDLPCIGPSTVRNMAVAHYNGIVLQAQKTLILSKDETIKLANEKGVFIYGA